MRVVALASHGASSDRADAAFPPDDANTIGWTATITDRSVFTRPWTIRWRLVRDPENREIWEHACVEGNKFGLWADIREREIGRKAR